MLHGDGDMFLICFEYDHERLCYVVMQQDISDADCFKGLLPRGVYYDWETPYGYGGPLVDATLSKEAKQLFDKELSEYCLKNGIISQFVRFHPLLQNHDIMPDIIETRYLRDTIFIDTTDLDLIFTNMDSKNRNMVRKAKKNNIHIERKSISEFEDFLSMYNETMQKNGATDYYTFQRDYFESLSEMSNNAFIMYALYEGRPISGAIMYYNDRYMHYHLSGSHTEYRKYSSGNLLLYEAACWAAEHGIEKFHLGGGMAPNDSLFGFKKQFNKKGRVPFVIGRTIFDEQKYNYLKNIRKQNDSTFEMDNGMLIQYRR